MGIVEQFGPDQISGWVECHDPQDREVSIKVNGLKVAHAVACMPVRFNGTTREFGFSRQLTTLWKYLGKDDVVHLEYRGEWLPIVGHGYKYVHPVDEHGQFRRMRTRLEAGYIFDKRGRLRPPLNARHEWQDEFFAEFPRLNDCAQSAIGATLFPVYGTLLGCVREHDFISFDHDIDIGYVSRLHEPELVAAEFLKLCEALKAAGFQGTVSKQCFGIKSPIQVDVYYCWFSEGKSFQIAYGYHGEELEPHSDFYRLVPQVMGRHTMLVPANGEKIVEQIYGTGWRIPDPGFSHFTRTRKLDRRVMECLREALGEP
jgi:hypothetical protein